MKVACYVRVSTENQLENYSIDEQMERLKAYCKAKDYVIYDMYVDGGYSGGNLSRPALSKMLSDIKQHKFDAVIVYKLDRLSRSQKDTLTLIEDSFLSNNIDFISISENFDTSTPFGRAMIGILSVFAQLEKDQITERFTMGRIGRSKAGYYHGGATAPTGYDYTNGMLVINQYTSAQVNEVYNYFLSGHSINSIQKLMHSKYDGWNSAALVLNVLRNSVYIGKVKFKGQEYDGVHEPIINNDTFDRVQALLVSSSRENNKTAAQKTPFKACNLLTSLIYCEHCGARYSGNHGYYKCYSRAKSSKKNIIDPNCKNDNWDISKLDDFIISEIYSLKYSPEKINSLFENKQDRFIDITAINRRIQEIDSQINKTIDLYQISKLPFEKVSKRIEALEKEKDGLYSQIPQTPKDVATSRQAFIFLLSRCEDVLSCDSLEKKRLYISELVEAVYIDKKKVSVKWRIQLS